MEKDKTIERSGRKYKQSKGMILIIGGAGEGQFEFARTFAEEENITADYHLILREEMHKGKALEDLLQRSLEMVDENPKGIITMNEVGCGVVPMDAFEREYRENCGRVSCALAEKAEAVYRMVCGIGQRIK